MARLLFLYHVILELFFVIVSGIRGEIKIIIKVDLFVDANKFRQSSCGVQFFNSKNFGSNNPF